MSKAKDNKAFKPAKYIKKVDSILDKMSEDINANKEVIKKKQGEIKFLFKTNAEFMICLKLHKLLIRCATKDEYIEAAVKIFNGCFNDTYYIKSRAMILIDSLNGRFEMLNKWRTATNNEKIAIYSAGKKIPPNENVFKAVFMVIDDSIKSGTAARKTGVNAASVTNLKVKFEQLDLYADLLHTATKNAVLSEGLLT